MGTGPPWGNILPPAAPRVGLRHGKGHPMGWQGPPYGVAYNLWPMAYGLWPVVCGLWQQQRQSQQSAV